MKPGETSFFLKYVKEAFVSTFLEAFVLLCEVLVLFNLSMRLLNLQWVWDLVET